MNWRLVPSSFDPPGGQMALDGELLKALRPGDAPILRFFYFRRPTLTLGRLEARRLNLEELPHPQEIRPTGGRAVLHGGEDLCYALAASVRDPLVGGDLLTSYRKVSLLLAEGIVSCLLRFQGLSRRFTVEPSRAHGQSKWEEIAPEAQ